jgi:TRAP-type mannitol/chloroaromatic compound transport system permease small subunit
MSLLLRFSNTVEAALGFIARLFSWAFIACITVITFDVITRKFGFQLPMLGSTRLQELEWQIHTLLFTTWLGYAYVRNSHVRIDVFVGGLSFRRKVWLELAGCLLFALPYLIVALPYAHDFFMTSFLQNESSDAPNGLPYRWIVKFFVYAGLWGVALAVMSVIARCVVVLFGPPELARRTPLPMAVSH